MVTGRGSARNAVLAITVPAAVSLVAYTLSYHRHRKMLLEVRATERAGMSAGAAGKSARATERLIQNPRELAAFSFLWKTLVRSGSHRLLLLAYAGIALGRITKGLLDAPPVNLRDEGLYGLVVVAAPIALSGLITVGLRYLFTPPVTLRAN